MLLSAEATRREFKDKASATLTCLGRKQEVCQSAGVPVCIPEHLQQCSGPALKGHLDSNGTLTSSGLFSSLLTLIFSANPDPNPIPSTRFLRESTACLSDMMVTRTWRATLAYGQGFSPVLLPSTPQDPLSRWGSHFLHAGGIEHFLRW